MTDYGNLINKIVANSEADNFTDAVKEWKIVDCVEDETHSGSCICGKENLRYLFTIRNVVNGNTLSPIGSSCIEKFNQVELNELTDVCEAEFKLYHAIASGQRIELSSDMFSRKLLFSLYNQGAFVANKYNNNDGVNDYNFLLDMFNRRNELTENQEKKVRAVLANSIKPFIQKKLGPKVKRRKDPFFGR